MDAKQLREAYMAGEIFRVGDLVEDGTTGELMQVIDRGSNYITVSTSNGTAKKWLQEVSEVEASTAPWMIEEGHLRVGSYTSKLDAFTSAYLAEAFSNSTSDDLFLKHQIVLNLDSISESNIEESYERLERVSSLMEKIGVEVPLLVEAAMHNIERKKVASLFASLAECSDAGTSSEVLARAIAEIKASNNNPSDWQEVFIPLLEVARSLGITVPSCIPFAVEAFPRDYIGEELDAIEVMVNEALAAPVAPSLPDNFNLKYAKNKATVMLHDALKARFPTADVKSSIESRKSLIANLAQQLAMKNVSDTQNQGESEGDDD